MVKKKGKSKRSTLKDKYKIQKHTAETHRKRKRQAKRDAADGKVVLKAKDPGIPNAWPFKQDLLQQIQRSREKQQLIQQEQKQKRQQELRALREHQEVGGSARTVAELLARAQSDQAAFAAKADQKELSDGTERPGQQSRRAYLRELKKVVDASDVLLQVLDARDPQASRIHPSAEDAILSYADKRMVLVLNKIDLVPKPVVGSWLTALRRSHPTIAVKACAKRSKETDVSEDSIVGMDGLLQLLKNYARTGGAGGKTKSTIVVGVIGYPNVGKSSIINALKRSRAVGVSPRPGFTTSMQEVVLDKTVRLLDSPGVVFDDRSALLGNCVDPDSLEDPLPAIEAILQRCDHDSMLMTYNLPHFPPGDVAIFLAMVARTYGKVLKGGIPDKKTAAKVVLKDWNSGKIPFYTTPTETKGDVSQATVVSSFAKELDMSKFDRQVMDSLEEKDEMDFVRLAPGEMTSGEVTQETVKYFAEGEEEADTMEEEEEEGEGVSEEAEDYDFDEMC